MGRLTPKRKPLDWVAPLPRPGARGRSPPGCPQRTAHRETSSPVVSPAGRRGPSRLRLGPRPGSGRDSACQRRRSAPSGTTNRENPVAAPLPCVAMDRLSRCWGLWGAAKKAGPPHPPILRYSPSSGKNNLTICARIDDLGSTQGLTHPEISIAGAGQTSF
jgi:hypothetical protein